jgi:hypothetical protein
MPGEKQPNLYHPFPEGPKNFPEAVAQTPKQAAKDKARYEAELKRQSSMSPTERKLDRNRKFEESINKQETKSKAEDIAARTTSALFAAENEQEYKRGGAVKSKDFRGDGVAKRGKTKGRIV